MVPTTMSNKGMLMFKHTVTWKITKLLKCPNSEQPATMFKLRLRWEITNLSEFLPPSNTLGTVKICEKSLSLKQCAISEELSILYNYENVSARSNLHSLKNSTQVSLLKLDIRNVSQFIPPSNILGTISVINNYK